MGLQYTGGEAINESEGPVEARDVSKILQPLWQGDTDSLASFAPSLHVEPSGPWPLHDQLVSDGENWPPKSYLISQPCQPNRHIICAKKSVALHE